MRATRVAASGGLRLPRDKIRKTGFYLSRQVCIILKLIAYFAATLVMTQLFGALQI
jgi:hypothetical protein